MRSRIATIGTVLALVAGTGGAIALAASGSSGSVYGGAASAQYKPGKGCGDKNHKHKKHSECKPPRKHRKHKHKKPHHKPAPHRPTHKAKGHKPSSNSKASYHCTYKQVGQNLVGTCRYY